MDVTVSGTYPADNKFTVIAYKGWGENERRWEYPAELKGNKLTTVLKEKELANSERFGLRVITSSPKTETNTDVFIRALTTPSLSLSTKSGYAGDTLNTTDPIELAITARPAGPGWITLNTGEQINLVYYDNDWPDGYTTFFTLPKTKEGVYTIREAHNVCGQLESNGQVTIRVNPIDFLPVNISPRNLCEGSEFKLLFNSNGAVFPSNTRFKVRFSVGFNGYLVQQKYIDVAARLSDDNELTGIFPAGFDDNESNLGIYVGIVTENPSAVAFNKDLKVVAKPRPGYTLTTNKPSIYPGEEIYIQSNPIGHPPFRFTFDDGKTFDYNFRDFPRTTTTYRISKMESGCGVAENPPGNPLTVVVLPGLLLGDTLNAGAVQRFCEGQTVRLKYRSSGVNPNTRYTIEAGTFDKVLFSFPCKMVGDSIEFFIPEGVGEDPELNYGDVTVLRLVSANPRLVSPPKDARIYGRPFMMMAEQSKSTVPFPSVIRMDYIVYGGHPYSIEMEDGTTKSYDSRNAWFYQFIKKDTTFKAAAIFNQCFRNPDPDAFSLKVGNPASAEPALYLKLIGKEYCMGDSVEVEVFFNGKFEAGNEFSLSYRRFADIETFHIMKISKPGIYKIKLPDNYKEAYDASVLLSSSFPRLISETERFRFLISPWSPTIFPQAPKENPAQVYLEYPGNISASSTPNSLITYSYNNVRNEALSDQNGRIQVPMELAHHQISEFKVLSVSNSCGTLTNDIASYFYGIAYKLVLDDYSVNYLRCAGMPTEIPFRIESGTLRDHIRFTLQISEIGNPETYTDLATTTGNQIFRFITPQLKAGSYYIRVKSSDDLYSSPAIFRIGEAPTAGIYVNNAEIADTTLYIEYGSELYLKSYLTGSEPFGLLYSNGDRKISNSKYPDYSFTVTENQTFSIQKVWNNCGYGTTSGVVGIKVKPIIELTQLPLSSEAVVCAGKEIELEYNIKGASDTGADYLVFSLQQAGAAKVKLDSVRSLNGRINLKLPVSIGQGYVSIIAEIPSLKAFRTMTYEVYASPDITLFGNNTITQGEAAVLYIRANNSFARNTRVTLSDGSTHSITSSFINGVTELTVHPSVTTTYTLEALAGQCGTGTVNGTATVIVEPRHPQWLSVSRVTGIGKSAVCNTDTIQVFFDMYGGQIPDTGFTLFLSDETGGNFTPVPTFGTSSPVKAVIPSSISESDYYKIRLASLNQAISAGSYPDKISVGEYVSAEILTPDAFYRPGEPVEAIIRLEGSKPAFYRFGDNNFAQYRSTFNRTDTIRLLPGTPEAVYRILEAGNKCGAGTIAPNSTFRISLLTSTEPVTEVARVRLAPNPTQGIITIYFGGTEERRLELFNLAGQKVYDAIAYHDPFAADLSTFPSGVYLLRISGKTGTTNCRVLKH